jgi:hypothetical protein
MSDYTFMWLPGADGLAPGALNGLGAIVKLDEGEYFPAASEFLAIPSDPSKSLIIRLRIAVEEGRPVCNMIAFERFIWTDAEGRSTLQPFSAPFITADLVDEVAVASLIDDAIVWLAVHAKFRTYAHQAALSEEGYSTDGTGRFSFWPPEAAESAGQKALGLRRQRSVNDEHLRKVAEIARQNPKHPTKSVAEKMITSHRNATRWIAAAKKFMEEESQNGQ